MEKTKNAGRRGAGLACLVALYACLATAPALAVPLAEPQATALHVPPDDGLAAAGAPAPARMPAGAARQHDGLFAAAPGGDAARPADGAPVAEPSTLLLVSLGLFGLIAWSRRRH